jgi:phosphoribosylglycinamide formyltransferase-1
MSSTPLLPIAVLISGGGTTLRNLIDKRRAALLPVDIRLVISSHPQARGLAYASEAGIPALVVERRSAATPEAFSEAVFGPCRAAGVRYVVMGGFLKHVLIPPDFENRVVNIHPALIPAFCGRGMYGLAVHQAALAYGVKITGCTVHFVDNEYDHGPILLQRAVDVLDDDTPETLQQRVFIAECAAYPDALKLLAEGRVQVVGRRVQVG